MKFTEVATSFNGRCIIIQLSKMGVWHFSHMCFTLFSKVTRQKQLTQHMFLILNFVISMKGKDGKKIKFTLKVENDIHFEIEGVIEKMILMLY